MMQALPQTASISELHTPAAATPAAAATSTAAAAATYQRVPSLHPAAQPEHPQPINAIISALQSIIPSSNGGFSTPRDRRDRGALILKLANDMNRIRRGENS